MKKILSCISLCTLLLTSAHAELTLIPQSTKMFSVSLQDDTITQFLHISFITLSPTVTMCYAVAIVNGKNRAIKKNMLNNPTLVWDYEEKFKKDEVDFFGLLGTKRVCILKNGDIYIIKPDEKTGKQKWHRAVQFRKYKDETIASCVGSPESFWITTYNKNTYQRSVVHYEYNKETKKYDLDMSSATMAYSQVAMSPDSQFMWFIKPAKDAKNAIIHIQDQRYEEGFSTLDLNITLSQQLPTIKQLVAFDDNQAFFTDTQDNVYSLKVVFSDETNSYSTKIESITTDKKVAVIGILNNQLVVAIGNELYKYLPPTRTLEITVAPKEYRSFESATYQDKPVDIKFKDASLEVTTGKPDNKIIMGTPIAMQIPEEKTVSFTPEQKSYLMRFFGSPTIQALLKKTVGSSIYNALLKRKNALTYETEALAKNPYPWEKFLKKPTLIQRTQNWLYTHSYGILGRKQVQSIDHYEFPPTKEGKRAELLQILYDEYPQDYGDIWLKKTRWDTVRPEVRQLLAAVNKGQIPYFGQYWLQVRLQDAQKIKKSLPSNRLHKTSRLIE